MSWEFNTSPRELPVVGRTYTLRLNAVDEIVTVRKVDKTHVSYVFKSDKKMGATSISQWYSHLVPNK